MQLITDPMLSVVIPVYNEAPCLLPLISRVSDICHTVYNNRFEIIIVNDGSTDDSWHILTRANKDTAHLKAINLSRNFGQQAALSCGLAEARGDHIFIIDADLQDPPELLAAMKEHLDDGFDVVYGQRLGRKGETWLKKWSAYGFYRVFNFFSSTPIPADTGDFRLMTRAVRDAFLAMHEKERFIRAMLSWTGFKQKSFPYHRDARIAGQSKYPFFRLLGLAESAITSFSSKPLRYCGLMLIIAIPIVIGLLSFLLYNEWQHLPNPTWLPFAFITASFSTIQILMLSIIAEYLNKVFIEIKDRPLFIIKEILG